MIEALESRQYATAAHAIDLDFGPFGKGTLRYHHRHTHDTAVMYSLLNAPIDSSNGSGGLLTSPREGAPSDMIEIFAGATRKHHISITIKGRRHGKQEIIYREDGTLSITLPFPGKDSHTAIPQIIINGGDVGDHIKVKGHVFATNLTPIIEIMKGRGQNKVSLKTNDRYIVVEQPSLIHRPTPSNLPF